MTEKNKLALIITTVVVSLFATVVLIYKINSRSVPEYFSLLPQDAAVIVKISDTRRVCDFFNRETEFTENIHQTALFSGMIKTINNFDSLIRANEKAAELFDENKMIVGLYKTQTNSSDFLYIIPVSDNITNDNIQTYVEKLTRDTKTINTRNYDGHNIHKVKFTKSKIFQNNELFFTVYNNSLLVSKSSVPVENTIREAESLIKKQNTAELRDLFRETESGDIADFFINYKQLAQISKHIIKRDNKKIPAFIEYFSNCTLFRLTSASKKTLSFSGHSIPEDRFSGIFQNRSNNVFRMFPEKTSAFVIYNFENGREFEKKMRRFHANNRDLNRYRRGIEKMYADFKVKISEYQFVDAVGQTVAMSYEDLNKNGSLQYVYGFVEIGDKDKMGEVLDSFMTAYSRKMKIKRDMFSIDYTSNGKTVRINKWPATKIIENYFGEVFSDLDAGAYAIIDNYLIFGPSVQSLREFFNSYSGGLTLTNRPDFSELKSKMSNRTALSFYFEPAHALSVLNETLNEQSFANVSASNDFFKTLRGPLIQFEEKNDRHTVQAFLNYDFPEETGNGTVWECKIDSLTGNKPFIVKNSATKQDDIFYQDRKNNLFHIDTHGNILWKIKLSGKILGTIHGIDYFKNGKIQYLFNTKNTLYLLDKNADKVGPYPVKLKTEASAPISVFDYDRNRDYRIFLPLKNKKVVLLNKNADIVGNWAFDKALAEVKNPVQYFAHKGKDYIVFSDGKKLYLLDRAGKPRIKLSADFPFGKNIHAYFEPETKTSKARFITTNTSGDVHFIYLDGSIKKMPVKNCFPEHYFIYEDITGDRTPEFIYLNKDELSVYDRNKEEMFSYKFQDEILYEPVIVRLNEKEAYIGITSSKDQNLYLFNPEGGFFPGFPKNGRVPMAFAKIGKKEKFSIISGNNGYLYHYPVKK